LYFKSKFSDIVFFEFKVLKSGIRQSKVRSKSFALKPRSKRGEAQRKAESEKEKLKFYLAVKSKSSVRRCISRAQAHLRDAHPRLND
jgi:hypothetical protein